MKPLTLAFILLVFCAAPFISFSQSTASNPFFLHGDGHLKIRNNHNGRTADVVYLKSDGTLDETAFTKIDAVFGFPTAAMGENVSRRTVAFLDYFIDLFNKDATVRLASGYRSQDYNNALRKRGATAAKTSTHIDGMALDFSLPGFSGKKIWETIRDKNCCGAGYYHGDIVHLDSGRPRWWTTATSKVRTGESDFNRYIYASTEYDRYNKQDRIRILFTSVSDFGFGVLKNFTVVRDEIGEDKAAAGNFSEDSLAKPFPKTEDCLKIDERKEARFIYLTLPAKLKSGTYRLRVDFCQKPFTEMPDFRVTNNFEILAE